MNNGVNISLDANGYFSVNRTHPSAGTISDTFVAIDKAGNTSSATYSATYDPEFHPISLSTSIITRTNYALNSGYSYDHRASASNGVYDFHVARYQCSQCSGEGVSVWASATYYGKINIYNLPNWQKIRKIKIDRYGYGQMTIYLNGSTSTYDFSDVMSVSSGTEHLVGHYAEVTATAGIKSLSYSYAD